MAAVDETPTIIEDYTNDLAAMEMVHASFEEKEKILMSQPIDQITNKETRSRVTDPTLLAAVLKQNNTVMAQMPSGKITALTKENRGKSLFMDIIFHNYVIPNATSQFDVYTKLWLLSFYRKAYGSMGALVDFVENKGYVGPDFTILPARAIIPQSGRTTIVDSDYTNVRTVVSRSWLEGRDKSKGSKWKDVQAVLDTKGDSISINAQSYVERQNEGTAIVKDRFEIVTRYEGDKWITFHPTTKKILREMDNPQKNEQIPVIMCHSYPLLDRFFGLGDFERGSTLHSSLGSLINLYMDGVKMSIFPPFKVDPMAIENWDDFKDGIGPGQVWLMKKGMFDGVEQMQVSPSGIESFQSTYQFLKAAVLTLTNTSDTSVSQATDPGFGKTPQALKMQQMNQGAQAQFDRRMLEISTEQIFDRMIDLVAKRQEKSMPLYLKEEDLKQVAEIAPDVIEMFDVGGMGKVTIKPQDINNCDYRYEIDQGSTVKKDEILENQSLTEILGFITKIPGAFDMLARGGLMPLGNMQLNLGELVKRWIISSGVTDWDKIIVEDEQQTDENAVNMEDEQMAGTVQQAFMGGQQPPMPAQPPLGMPTQQPQPVDPGFQDPATAAIFQELTNLAQGGGGVNNNGGNY